MLQRTSVVDHFHVSTVSLSSIIQIGDSTFLQGASKALAVQREKELFFGKEGDFSDYPIFTKRIPLLPISENISLQFENRKPLIKVHDIAIIGIAASSIFHIGSSQHIYMESRVKHIRHMDHSENIQRDNPSVPLGNYISKEEYTTVDSYSSNRYM
ncbi:spore germination protein GerPE [Bacillus sp. 03113]|uniref:spore germination protein GerPE n=1 Tax=Bacillus sp. 03113 TaxID=2578211 RepID=UPI00114258D8|nr:spore germination protein GerPE [Bacillus sp. 03113]